MAMSRWTRVLLVSIQKNQTYPFVYQISSPILKSGLNQKALKHKVGFKHIY